MNLEEQIARVIARKLGHNDETGMYWEQYILAARGIIAEFCVEGELIPVRVRQAA